MTLEQLYLSFYLKLWAQNNGQRWVGPQWAHLLLARSTHAFTYQNKYLSYSIRWLLLHSTDLLSALLASANTSNEVLHRRQIATSMGHEARRSSSKKKVKKTELSYYPNGGRRKDEIGVSG